MKIFNDDAVAKYNHMLRFEYDLFREVILDRLIRKFGYDQSKKYDETWLYRITRNYDDDLSLCEGNLMYMFMFGIPQDIIISPTKAFAPLLKTGEENLERSLINCIWEDEAEIFSQAELQLLEAAIEKRTIKEPDIREMLDAFVIYHLKHRLTPSSSTPSSGGSRTRYDYYIPLLKPFAESVAPTLLTPASCKQLNQIIKFHAGIYEPIRGYEAECEFLKMQKDELFACKKIERPTYASLWE